MSMMIMKVAFLTIILSIASSAMGQLRDAAIGPKTNRLGQSGGTKKEDISPSDPEVRDRRNLAHSESGNLFKSFEKSLLATSGKKKRGRRRLGGLARRKRLDLGIRFSKIIFVDQNTDTSRLPLKKFDYPIDVETALWLSSSQCPSITIPENCDECDTNFETLIKAIHGKPTHPSRNPNSPYWGELREVTLMQEHRRNGTDPKKVMPIPKIWENLTIEGVAAAVHNEYPGEVQVELIKYLIADGAKVDNSTIPLRCKVEFLRGIVMLAELNTWAIGTVGAPNFGLKYHVGRARAEEIAFLISEGKLTSDDGVPNDILSAIPLKSLEKAVDYTAYPEGSPMHPSWPAMHSAASSASFWLAIVLNLTPDQWCQAKLADYGVAYARTVAGVHFPDDNIAGLNFGQEIVASKLAEHLAIRYGSDLALVQQKIDSKRFDWREFLASDCAKNFGSFLGSEQS